MADAGEENKRPQFGNRFLTDPKQVFEHNAWDNVVWDEEQEAEARLRVSKNSQTPVSEEDREKYEQKADVFWDEFYMQHKNRFFKDRHWLFTEFPELAPNGVPDHIPKRAEPSNESNPQEQGLESTSTTDGSISDDKLPTEEAAAKLTEDGMNDESESTSPSQKTDDRPSAYPGEHTSTRFLEVGCGVGNTVFPVLQTNNDPNLFVYCCDLSQTAIQLVREHPDYTASRCHGFVCDVSCPDAQFPFPEQSLDLVVLIFVLSAIHPDKMQATIDRLALMLKPGGRMVFRDYARYDLAQLRFKDGKCLQDNFYVRGDGTRVYFFTQDEMRSMFTKSGLVEEQNLIDRRLQVNRGRQLKMYRVWIQCKYRKPSSQ